MHEHYTTRCHACNCHVARLRSSSLLVPAICLSHDHVPTARIDCLCATPCPLPTGVCGDPFEGGSAPGFGPTSRSMSLTYPSQSTVPNDRITITVNFTANHGGKFGFGICPRTSNLDQPCFNRNPLTRVNVPGEKWFWMMTSKRCCCKCTCTPLLV